MKRQLPDELTIVTTLVIENSHTQAQSEPILRRLSCIEGHVRAIRRMVDAESPCAEVLVQVAAVRAALQSVGWLILEDHLRDCLDKATQTGDVDEAFGDLKQLMGQFLR